VVILAGNWAAFDTPQQFCFAKDGRCVSGQASPDRAFAVRQSQAFVAELLRLGKRVVLVQQSPFLPFDVGIVAMRHRWLGLAPIGDVKPRFKTTVDADIAKPFLQDPSFGMVNLWPLLCPDDMCRIVGRDGAPIFYDTSHLMPDWIRAHGGAFSSFLAEPLDRPSEMH
jgi:hypothetical protein